eukprot:CAMPEP_0183427086 /NCGR_PEP_ID=MMETSP0370-20130417/40083_1 /TAXON_ID=268820 /ORGANISM="Peridinium aciculiferum, Strain PAER-2" /LENGTH=162 /DNA_ID=CAMNT_0025611599 /DNA_START=273 /DNA_END=762 /DNA_ORIENTATION=-
MLHREDADEAVRLGDRRLVANNVGKRVPPKRHEVPPLSGALKATGCAEVLFHGKFVPGREFVVVEQVLLQVPHRPVAVTTTAQRNGQCLHRTGTAEDAAAVAATSGAPRSPTVFIFLTMLSRMSLPETVAAASRFRFFSSGSMPPNPPARDGQGRADRHEAE